jgi:hypothetical protein
MTEQQLRPFLPNRDPLEDLSPRALYRRARAEGYSRDEVRRMSREEVLLRLRLRDRCRAVGLPPGYADRWPADRLESLVKPLSPAGRVPPA